MADCPFCAPRAVSTTFAEARALRALYNIAPIVPGHSLVVPERHVVRLLELEEPELAALTGFARKISALLMEVFKATGIDWIIQDGPEAGQTVMHLHLHLIPRIEGDFESPGDWYPVLRTSQTSAVDSEHRHRLAPDQLARAVARLRAVAAAGCVAGAERSEKG